MYYVRLSFFAWILCLLWSAGSLSISFPPSGTPTAAFDSQMVEWKRDKSDPNVQFFLQRIKLDEPDGPTTKSSPIPIDNSQGGQGTSPMQFNRAGLFEILAVNLQNGQPFFTTEITVAPNPTSTGGPPAPTASSNSVIGVNKSSSALSATTTSATTTSLPTNASSGTSATPNLTSYTVLIIGAVAGGVGLFFIVGVILLCLHHRRHIIRIQTSSTMTRHSEKSTPGFISPFALGRPVSPSEEKHRPRSIQRERTLPGLQSEESNIPLAPSTDQPLPSRIQQIRSALNISMDGGINTLDNNASFENPGPSPTRNSYNVRPFRHQDSGLRVLPSFRSRDSGVTELPPDYSSV